MRKHIAKVSAVWPNLTNNDLSPLYAKKAYSGLSLSNPNYFGDRLLAVIRFLGTHFNSSLLITTGYVYRLHYQLYFQDKDTALNHALENENDYFKNELLPALSESDLSHKIKTVRWYDLYNTKKFQESLSEIQIYYSNELSFKDEIDSIAKAFIRSKLKNTKRSFCCSEDTAIQLSIEFLLEESAVFNLIALDGYTVDVYPGVAIPILKDINCYMDPPSGLKQRKIIELSIQRRGRKKKLCTSLSSCAF